MKKKVLAITATIFIIIVVVVIGAYIYKPKNQNSKSQNPDVMDSVVYGLDEPMQFEPGKYYDFSVVGAGEDNDNPKEGDMKWVPKYWSMVKNPSDEEKKTSWKIGTDKGISESNTYNLYVFFQKNVYEEHTWKETDNVKSVAYQFVTAEIKPEENRESNSTENSSSDSSNEDSTHYSSNSSSENHICQADGCYREGIKTVTGISGKTEYYCQEHYDEIQDIIDMMETDVGNGTESRHTCAASGCNKEGTNPVEGFGGTEDYCTEHYNDLIDIINSMAQ